LQYRYHYQLASPQAILGENPQEFLEVIQSATLLGRLQERLQEARMRR
jgi:hypothetical protein